MLALCVFGAGVLAFTLCLFSKKSLFFSRFALHIRECLGVPARFVYLLLLQLIVNRTLEGL